MKRYLCLLVIILSLCSMLPTAVFADTVDPNKEGSITVKVVKQGVALKDLKLSCVKIAKLENNEFVGVYERIHYTQKDLDNPDFAKNTLTYVMDNISHFKTLDKRVDSNGYVTFNGLLPGLYLIYQPERYTLNGKEYTKINPFVVSIPYKGKYNVDATSKPSLDVYPPPTTTPPSTPPNLPQTGQLNWPIPVLASGGMLLFALGWWLVFGSRKDSYDA